MSAAPSKEFNYRALGGDGQIITGQLRSQSRQGALRELTTRGVTPLELLERSATDGPKSNWIEQVRRRMREPLFQANRGMGQRQWLDWTQSMSRLLTAGLTVERALVVTQRLTRVEALRTTAASVVESVRGGKGLAQALQHLYAPPPSFYISMVQAGEVGGTLPQTLVRLAELLRQQRQVRDRVRSALLYPSLLAGVVVLTLILLLAFVLPRFEGLFAESSASLPWSTKVVMALGRWVADYWPFLFSGALAAIAAAWYWLRTASGAERFDAWLLKSRLTLGIPASIGCARLLRTVASLQRSGTPLPTALKTARGTLSNRVLDRALGDVINRVQAGETLSASMERTKVFPPESVQLALVGEETGHLPDALDSAAGTLEEQTNLVLERALAMLVPGLTIVMGLVVAGLIGSVLMGLLSINDLAME
jgi:general secretion pathway protein F